MQIFEQIKPLKAHLLEIKRNKKTIGFVPTMGALHKGHLALVRKSVEENDTTVCSIYINPTQFNNKEDFEKYPKSIKNDIRLLQESECDVTFIPDNTTMYPESSLIQMNFGSLSAELEGRYRPGHFSGVGLIVTKLFNIVNPDNAYFGQKDLQQCLIIKQLVKDLFFDINVKCVPTVREDNGLAMSSRNKRLSGEAREKAADIYKLLKVAKGRLLSDKQVEHVKNFVEEYLIEAEDIDLEYFEVVRLPGFEIVKKIEEKGSYALCIAAHVNGVRLIDNVILKEVNAD